MSQLSHIKNTEKGKLRFFSNEQEMNQQQEAINTNCINHTQDWTLENTHSHILLKYGTI